MSALRKSPLDDPPRPPPASGGVPSSGLLSASGRALAGVPAWLAARIRRSARRVILPCLLYAGLAVAALSPLAYRELPESPAFDCANHTSGIIEARNALKEGQFPIRVAPHQVDGTRYPVFQYYGNFPYTAGGLIYLLTGASPYTAFRAVLLLGLLTGSYFTYRCSWRFSRRWGPSVLAGAVFCLAPYLLTDIHARFAYPEVVSFCLLPPVFYFSLRAFHTRRASAVLGGAVTWALLALSHNITYFYASFLFAVYFATFLGWRRRAWQRLARVGVAHLLGFLLAAWYLVPQAMTLSSLAISASPSCVSRMRWLTSLPILLAPTMVLPAPYPEPMPHPSFGLQIGWPILGAVLLAGSFAFARGGRATAERLFVRRVVVVFGLAFFLVWSPVDFWPYVPKVFHFLQFTYRLLMFTTLWGAVLVGYALKHLLPEGFRLPHFCLGMGLLGVFAGPYLPSPRTATQVTLAGEVSSPNMGRGGAATAYRLGVADLLNTYRPLTAPETGNAVIDLSRSRRQTHVGRVTTCWHRSPLPCVIQLPVLYYPRMIQVKADGKRIGYGSLDGYLAVRVPEGDHRIDVRFVGIEWANRVSALAWAVVLCGLLAPAAWAVGRRRRAKPGGLVRRGPFP